MSCRMGKLCSGILHNNIKEQATMPYKRMPESQRCNIEQHHTITICGLKTDKPGQWC